MEERKLKKLTLTKETITSLSEYEQDFVKGGATYNEGPTECYVDWNYYYEYDCSPPPPDTGINQCPNYSQVGSGCYAETCGWADTCNGR